MLPADSLVVTRAGGWQGRVWVLVPVACGEMLSSPVIDLMRCGTDRTALIAVRKPPCAAVGGGETDVWSAQTWLAKVLRRVCVAVRVAAGEGERRPLIPCIRCCRGNGGGGRPRFGRRSCFSLCLGCLGCNRCFSCGLRVGPGFCLGLRCDRGLRSRGGSSDRNIQQL